MARAYIGIGANLGDARNAVLAALSALGGLPATHLVAASSLYRTPAWGPVAQPDYVNAVAAIDTGLSPRDLLERLLSLERRAGRDRGAVPRWGPRTLDLDLLLHGDARIDEDGLHLPHPRMHERAFVIVPLAEIAPRLHIPGVGDIAGLRDALSCSGIEALG